MRTTRRDDGRESGFTLVELLVVMIIIGVLAAVAVPVFLQQRVKAVDTSIRSDLRGLSQEVALYDANNPGTLKDAAPFGYITTASAASMAGSGLNLVTSGTNTVEFRALADGAYCLRGWSTKASTTGRGGASGGSYFFFDSRAGGVRPGPASATSANC